MKDISKTAIRAHQAWPLLIWAAKHQQILTYKDLYECTGLAKPGVGSIALDPIWKYCQKKGYPALTAIVVNSETWLPGDELNFTPDEVPEMQKNVFQYNWNEAESPTPEILEEYK